MANFSLNYTLIKILLVFIILSPYQVQCQTLNEPVNINWIFSLPWDVANTLRAPFAGPLSILLTAITAAALLMGLLLAPVSYVLGYPPRIYHSYRKPGILGFGRSLESKLNGNLHNNEEYDMADLLYHVFEQLISSTQIVFDKDEDYEFVKENFTGRELTVYKKQEEYKAPGFIDSIFYFIPEKDETCRQLLVCHAHGFLQLFPSSFVRIYKVLSKQFTTIPDEYKTAIKVGLGDQGQCQKVYSECSKDLFYLTRGTIGMIRQAIIRYFPFGTKDGWKSFYAAYGSRDSG